MKKIRTKARIIEMYTTKSGSCSKTKTYFYKLERYVPQDERWISLKGYQNGDDSFKLTGEYLFERKEDAIEAIESYLYRNPYAKSNDTVVWTNEDEDE